MAVAAIRHPREFTLPASTDAIIAMLDELNQEDLAEMAKAFFEALDVSRQKDDLRPVQRVLEAWYRTTLLRRDPEHAQLTREAHARAAGHVPSDVETQTVDELRDDIARRRAS